jgi:NAD(P)-dependent dehydrogenase (short-subunit alcohol dehydrogenase family)
MPLTAIVTGAASGIGQEACRSLLKDGWIVYGIDISDAALAPAARSLASDRFHPRPCDLRDAAAVAETMRGIKADAPKVNALIAAAGILRTGRLMDMPVDDFDLVMEVNVRGLWLTCREAMPMLRAATAAGEIGRVILLSSIAAMRPRVESGAYSASKAAVSQLTQILAAEVAEHGILVNALAPGTVDTPMVRDQARISGNANWQPSGNSPLGRIAQPVDIVRVMRFLLSENADYVTGTIIPVDGGTRAATFPPRA